MVTTIQLNENVKRALDGFKFGRQTYEDVILDLMKFADKFNKEQRELMIEGCKEMAEENIKITKEFESLEDFRNWEW